MWSSSRTRLQSLITSEDWLLMEDGFNFVESFRVGQTLRKGVMGGHTHNCEFLCGLDSKIGHIGGGQSDWVARPQLLFFGYCLWTVIYIQTKFVEWEIFYWQKKKLIRRKGKKNCSKLFFPLFTFSLPNQLLIRSFVAILVSHQLPDPSLHVRFSRSSFRTALMPKTPLFGSSTFSSNPVPLSPSPFI